MRAEPAKRGPKPKPTVTKQCEWCGEDMRRKRWTSGRLETPKQFEARKFCGATCHGESDRREGSRRAPEYRDRALRLHGYERCERCDTLRPPAELEGHELKWKDGSTRTAKLCKAEAWCKAAARGEAS